jgi:nucleoside-diphosphate-sugar epimerase
MLIERDHEVFGFDSDLFRNSTYHGTLSQLPELQMDVRDLKVSDFAEGELQRFDVVIHLAGLSNDPLGDYQPSLTTDINQKASIRLAELAKRAGIKRFIFASSCSNYGASGNDFLNESSPFNPVTPYGRSKVEVEKAVRVMADDTFSPTFLRASTAYGFSPRLRFDLVVNNLSAWAFTTGEVRLKSDGRSWRPIIHVADLAQAYISILEADRTDVHNEAFNVGTTTENYLIRDIAKIVHDAIPGSTIGFADDASPDARNYRVDCGYIARRLPTYKPQWTCRRGVEQLCEAYASTGLKLEDFEGPRFNRIAQVKQLIDDGQIDTALRWLPGGSASKAAGETRVAV